MNNIMAQLLSKKKGIHLLWEGNDSWLIYGEGKMIGFDLDLYNVERIKPCSLNVDLLAKNLELHFISHEHEDHFNELTCKLLLEKGKCTFIIPKSCKEKAKKIGIPNERILEVEPGDNFKYKDISITCMRAIHGHIGQSIYTGASFLDCGYRFTIGEVTFYQPGDTVLLEEHLTMEPVKVLFISPTEHNTYIGNSLKIIEHMKPKYIFPQHHSTYIEQTDNLFWTHGYVEELFEKLASADKEKFHKLEPGHIFSL